MSLNSFFDSLDSESQFEGWKSSIKQRLYNLYHNIPNIEDNQLVIKYILETLKLLESNNINKKNLTERLRVCNSFYKKFGTI